jgi:hypothetical protein
MSSSTRGVEGQKEYP